MYHFAVVALLGLAVLKLADLIEDYVPALAKVNALLTFALAVGACLALDYSMFKGFDISVPETWMGPWFTGFMVGGFATVWRVFFGYLGSSEGKSAEERHPQRPRIAA